MDEKHVGQQSEAIEEKKARRNARRRERRMAEDADDVEMKESKSGSGPGIESKSVPEPVNLVEQSRQLGTRDLMAYVAARSQSKIDDGQNWIHLIVSRDQGLRDAIFGEHPPIMNAPIVDGSYYTVNDIQSFESYDHGGGGGGMRGRGRGRGGARGGRGGASRARGGGRMAGRGRGFVLGGGAMEADEDSYPYEGTDMKSGQHDSSLDRFLTNHVDHADRVEQSRAQSRGRGGRGRGRGRGRGSSSRGRGQDQDQEQRRSSSSGRRRRRTDEEPDVETPIIYQPPDEQIDEDELQIRDF